MPKRTKRTKKISAEANKLAKSKKRLPSKKNRKPVAVPR
jgi:hypothetical protein